MNQSMVRRARVRVFVVALMAPASVAAWVVAGQLTAEPTSRTDVVHTVTEETVVAPASVPGGPAGKIVTSGRGKAVGSTPAVNGLAFPYACPPGDGSTGNNNRGGCNSGNNNRSPGELPALP